jgi:trans-aconitate 2-methyltransferase
VPTRDWNAMSYHRVSGPMEELGRTVLERLPLDGDETVLDAGCGTGRITRLLLERLPRGRVIAVDGSPSMVDLARRELGERADVRQADLLELELSEPVDAILSTATFHWIPDHPRLFARLAAALRPGGRLVVQCGGEGNVANIHAAARAVGAEEPYAAHLAGWSGPWNFSTPERARRELEDAGFTEVEAWLQPVDVHPDDPREFLATIVLGPHRERLPEDLRDQFVEAVVERLGEPVTIDYVRLNLHARRARDGSAGSAAPAVPRSPV